MAEIIGIPGRLQSVQAADFVGMRSYVASQRTRKLLFIYNFIDNVIFNLPVMKPFRPFLLTSGEKL